MNPQLERQQKNINSLPKQFINSVLVGYLPDHFLMLLTSGDTDTVYALTPEHAKMLSQYLAFQVAEFEKNVRPLNVKWDPNIASPIQLGRSDTGGPESTK